MSVGAGVERLGRYSQIWQRGDPTYAHPWLVDGALVGIRPLYDPNPPEWDPDRRSISPAPRESPGNSHAVPRQRLTQGPTSEEAPPPSPRTTPRLQRADPPSCPWSPETPAA